MTNFPDDEGVNQQDRNNNTPLHYACGNGGNLEMVKMLLSHSKIDVNLIGYGDKLPEDDSKNEEIKMLVKKHRETPTTPACT